MHKWMICIVLAFFWIIVAKDFIFGDTIRSEKAKPILFYVLPSISIVAFWWYSSFKRVTLDGDALIVSDFRQEVRIPASNIEKIYKRRGGKGPDFVTIKFKSKTESGRRIRIIVGSSGMNLDRVAKILQGAMEGKDTSVKINHVSRNSVKGESQNQKEVIVSGWTDEELSKILTDFADGYGDDLGKEFGFEVCSIGSGSIRITFPHNIPAKHFSFLVNYLNYPKNFDLKARSISVIGKATLSADFHPPEKDLVGQKAVFYIPSNDQDYDLVYVRVGNETFVNPFTTLRWKKVEDSRIPPGIEIS